MHRKPLLLASLLTLAAPAAIQAQEFAADSAIQRIIDARIASKRGTGFVIAVLENGKQPRIHTAGTTGVDGLPLDANTIFEIGSITKVFTSTLLSEMVSRGEVKLDDPISKYLPAGVTVPSRNGRQITLADLATQSSGLPRLPTNLRPASVANPYADYTVRDLYDFLSSYTLTRDIGSKYEYSNLGVGLLGHVLALRAGRSYESLLRERVLDPLGMTETGITLTSAQQRKFAHGFNALGQPVQAWDLPTLAGAGALRSSMTDMLRFLAASLDPASRPLGSIMARTRESRHEADRPGNSIGLGWHIVNVFGTRLTWHNGGTGGYRAFIGMDEAKHRGVVVLTNSTVSPDDIGFHLLEPRVPLDLPAAPPPPRTEIAMDSTKLEAFVGVYELAPAFMLVVTREGSMLFGQATGQGKIQLHAGSPTKFFLREVDAQVSFIIGEGGKAASLVLHQGGANIPGKRIR